MSLHVDLSNYEKFLKYRRPEGFEFQYSTDKTYVWVPEDEGFSSGEVVSESGDNVKVRTEKGNVSFVDFFFTCRPWTYLIFLGSHHQQE